MRSPVPKLLLILVALALIPLGASAQVACCAGMSSMNAMDMDMDGNDTGCGDGMSCCEKAHDDALARHCCEGGDNLDRFHSVPRVFAVAPVVVPAAPTLGEPAFTGAGWFPVPTAKPPDLVTLHAAFLI